MKEPNKIEKCIFQVKYKSLLNFYNILYKQEKLFEHFPHWQTDRLNVNLRDYELKHSLTIQHDSITYETDKYLVKKEEDVVNLISDNLPNIISLNKVQRFGHRYLCLMPLTMEFEELVNILNLKVVNKEYSKVFSQSIMDSSFTINSRHKELDFRLLIGPMKNSEIPKFIPLNTENHFDPSSLKKYSEISQIIENYPKISLFFDIDFFIVGQPVKLDTKTFYDLSKSYYKEIFDNFSNYIFENKLK